MKATSQIQRQSLACGYEPAAEGRVHLTIWQPPSGNARCGYKGPTLTVCAGYTANLPDVIEVAVTRAHWKHGEIVAACDGEMPGEDLRNAVLVLDGEYSAVEGWMMTPSKDGGGGA
jgi:hypothetical protein